MVFSDLTVLWEKLYNKYILEARCRGSVGKHTTAIFNAEFRVGSSPGMDVNL